MTAKTKDDVIASIKAIRAQIEAINQERSVIADKLVQLELELNQYRTERDSLEAEQSKADSLLISGKMTDEQFNANRRKLSALYESIDSATEREAIYRKALEQQSAKLLTELNEQLSATRKILAGLEIRDIAVGIAGKNEPTLRKLVALIHYHNPNLNESFSQLGKTLAAAIFGESHGTPVEQDRKESIQLAKQILETLEV